VEAAIWLAGPDDHIIRYRPSSVVDVEWQAVSEIGVVQKINSCTYRRGSSCRFGTERMSINAVVEGPVPDLTRVFLYR
jgi:hypothetical protein